MLVDSYSVDSFTPISFDDADNQTNSDAPLSVEHLAQITLAKQRAKKIHKACSLATVNGNILAIFSGCSLLMAAIAIMLGEIDTVGLIMGIGLGILSRNEFHGRDMLRRFEIRACRLLGWNQIALLVFVILYAVWMLGNVLWGVSPYEAAIAAEPMLAGSLGSIDELYKTASIALYGGVIAGTFIFQGLNAWYYFTREKHVATYVSQTPPWVLEVQRNGGL